jgi:hypothetical protein
MTYNYRKKSSPLQKRFIAMFYFFRYGSKDDPAHYGKKSLIQGSVQFFPFCLENIAKLLKVDMTSDQEKNGNSRRFFIETKRNMYFRKR